MSPAALVGGNEFRRECDAMDRALLALAGGQGTRVCILPTAAAHENPNLAAENGIRHFRRLGADPARLMIVDRAAANQVELAAQLEQFPFIYLTGGDPIYLLDTLRGSQAWDAILAVHERGGLIAGSSAGGMVLGGQTWRPGFGAEGWAPGLGLLPGLALLPHHATLAGRWDAAAMAAGLPAGVTLAGIDEATALVLPEGRVLGAGQVTVYGPQGPETYAEGESAQLP